MKKILIMICLTALIYAEVPGEGQAPPNVNNDQYFPNQETIGFDHGNPTSASDTTSMVGSDQLPEDHVEGAFVYSNETGVNRTTLSVNEEGTTLITNTTTGKVIEEHREQDKSANYTNKRQAYFDSVANKEPIETQRAKLAAAKLAAKDETFNHGFNLKTMEKSLQEEVDPAAGGQAVVNNTFLRVNPEDQQSDQEIKDMNATIFYRTHYSVLPDSAHTERVEDSNVDSFKTGKELVDKHEEQVNGKLNSGIIMCYISRELIPAFFCTYPDMTNVAYPDFSVAGGDPLKVSSEFAEKTCNGLCKKDRTCLNYNVLDSVELDPSLGPKTIYPYNAAASYAKVNANPEMQLDVIEFDIEVEPSASFEGNETEFNEFIQRLPRPLTFRTTITKDDPTGVLDTEVIYKTENTQFKGSRMHKVFRIGRAAGEFNVKFFKPFIYDKATQKYKERPFMKMISSIKITNIQGTYANTDLYFCPFRQMIDTNSECRNGEVIDLATESAVYHMCTNASHKIGPDPVNGGFYSEDACQVACKEYKKCQVTYKHYAEQPLDSLFKAKIGCVDSKENGACTEQKCKDFFADPEIRPINELVIQNDKVRVYTIKQKALTGEPRPKIDYDEEINTINPDYGSIFQTEMKDGAMKAMVENQTFDKVEYLIGTPSPAKNAYNKSVIGDKTTLETILKPDSYHFENGKTYNVYSVIRFEQSYRPAFGIFQVDGHSVDAKYQDVMLKDEMFIIRNSAGAWRVFKQIQFSRVRIKKDYAICGSGSYELAEGQKAPSNCKQQTRVVWSDMPSRKTERNVFFTGAEHAHYGNGQTADIFKSQPFNSDIVKSKFLVTNDLMGLLEAVPGAVIHSQVEALHGASFGKVYTGPFNGRQRGYPANVFLYSFYTESRLSYGQLINDYLTEENTIWELANPGQYASSIKDDGVITDNINPLIVGAPNNTTLDVEMYPKFTEEGNAVFKFLFLFDADAKDPFKRESNTTHRQ